MSKPKSSAQLILIDLRCRLHCCLYEIVERLKEKGTMTTVEELLGIQEGTFSGTDYRLKLLSDALGALTE